MPCTFVFAALTLVAGIRAAPLEVTASLLRGAPERDGRIDPAEWAGAAGFDGFVIPGDGILDRRRVRALAGATETHIYIAVRSQVPEEGTLLSDVDKDSERLVFDDGVEVWIDPSPGEGNGAAYQMIANPQDRRYFAMHARGRAQADPGWSGDWRAASGFHDGWWHWEAAIPIASIAAGRKATEGAWGINICRNWKRPWTFSSLNPARYPPGGDTVFRFVSGGLPSVRHESRRDWIGGDVESVLAIGGAEGWASPIRVRQRLQRDRMPDIVVEEILPPARDGVREIPLRVRDRASTLMSLSIDVASADGKTILYRRDIEWRISPEAWTWKTSVIAKPPIDIQFAYYPYLEKLRLLADVSGLPARAKLDSLDVSVRPRDRAARILAQVALDRFDENGRQAAELDLGGLDGEYEIAARPIGEGVPAGEVRKPFVRYRYEWERKGLGTSTEVFAPFEPLRIEGNRLRAVLREHGLNGEGLWDQVTAMSAETGIARPILAAPMRFRARIGGEERKVVPVPLRVKEEKAHRIVTEGGFTAGPLEARTRSTWDVDGLMSVELTLLPTGGEAVGALDLEIPFRDEAAPLMHAMTEGIRAPIWSQRVPEGQGKVWDASRLKVQEFPPKFCTYIYLGSAVRGIAWFAENDRGWGWRGADPNLEVIRDGAGLVLRVHLIDAPQVIDAPRTLAFGLQAAPVKPRLSPWRYRYYRDGYTLLGTDINWLALGDCGSVYPAGKDLYLWEMIARGNRERLSDAEVEGVIERGRKYFEPYGEERLASFAAHVRHNLRSRYGKKMIFYYNRASYQAADEFQTFQDEWSLSDYRTVGPGNGIGEIKIVPSESYIDHALHWYGKSFDIAGNRGVYWDNWFFAATLNTPMTPAYARPDGSIVPATGMSGLRELCRRTFQYMNERRMTPITMVHMTSTNILPLHGFATVQYDWEWKYSEGDVQDRFSREYILLVTTGDLAGTWPVLLGDHGPQGRDPWTQRTFAAVSIVHELDPAPVDAKAWKPLIDPIIALLDEEGLEVYRYWDERPQPIRSDHPDVPVIVYCVPGREAIVAAVSYAQEDLEVALAIDPAALGFSGAVAASDVESGASVPIRENRIAFSLARHDIRELRIAPAGEGER
ncbi:MAG: hypothetical protein JXP34_14780 [Planctomycetes bacterium]|nr:hypothetical protein [Planctomycetota bacterium]